MMRLENLLRMMCFFFHRIIDDIIIIRTSMDLQVKIVIYYLGLVQIKLIFLKKIILKYYCFDLKNKKKRISPSKIRLIF